MRQGRVLMIVALAGLCACTPAKTQNPSGTTGGEPPVQRQDPLAASSLRERALAIVEESSRSEDAQIRANAAEAAGFAAARLEGAIERALNDRHWAVRSVALMTVGRARLARFTSYATAAGGETSGHVRASAIYALTRTGSNADQSPLAGILLRDPSLEVRSHAAFVLGEIGNRTAQPLLRDALRDPMRGVGGERLRLFHLQCAEAMVKLGDDAQRGTLRAALYPSNPEDLEAAALAVQIMGQVRDREAIDQLIYLSGPKGAAGSPMPAEVRLGIAAALARMGVGQGGFIADEYASSTNPTIRAQVAYVYGEIGTPEALGKLGAMLADPSAAVRISAAAAVLRASLR